MPSDKILILSFGTLALVLTTIGVLIKTEKGWGPSSMRIMITAIALTLGLFILTMGLPQTSVTTAFTLLGLVTGYAFGKT